MTKNINLSLQNDIFLGLALRSVMTSVVKLSKDEELQLEKLVFDPERNFYYKAFMDILEHAYLLVKMNF